MFAPHSVALDWQPDGVSVLFILSLRRQQWLCVLQNTMAVGKKPAAAPLKGKKKPATFVIDCAKPVEDKIMKIGEFEKFLVDKIKVDNKVGASLDYQNGTS